MVSSKSPVNVIDYLLRYFKGASELLPGSRPGFSHALKLSRTTIDPNRISVTSAAQPKNWTYRYQLSPHVPRYSLGLLTALMDELSTDAVFRAGLPAAPGLSLQMQTEVVDQHRAREYFEDPTKSQLDIINTVAKLGKTISHTRTEFRCPSSNELIAFSSHVKYMPSGSFYLDYLFRHRRMYDLYVNTALGMTTLRTYEEKALFQQVLIPQLQYHDGDGKDITDPQATFIVTTEHTNPFGALHGGCHAMIMEQVGVAYATKQLGVDREKIFLEAIQVEYLSAGKQGPVDIYCELLGDDDTSTLAKKIVHVRVCIKLQKNSLTSSEGILRLSLR